MPSTRARLSLRGGGRLQLLFGGFCLIVIALLWAGVLLGQAGLWSASAGTLLILAFAGFVLLQLSRDAVATNRLRESEQQYRALMVQAADAILILDRNGRFTEANGAACEMLGYECEEILRIGVENIVPAEDLRRAPLRLSGLEAGEILRSERRLTRKDGTSLLVDISSTLLSDGRIQSILRDVTNRRRAEQALRDSENLFKEFAENVPEIIWMRETESQDFLYFNPQWEKITGWPPPRDRTDSLAHVHPDDLEWARANVIAYPRGGADAEYRVVRPDGSLRWLSVRTFPVRNSVGEIYRVAGVGVDVTERKHAELALRENEERLREAQRLARIGSWEIDLIGNRRVWSEEVFRTFEIDPARSDPSRETFLAVVHPEDRDAVTNAYNESLRDRTPYEITHRLLMADGRVKFIHERGEATYDDRGRARCLRGTAQDVTERVESQKVIANSLARLQELADRLLAVQEEERRAISRELHDEIGQGLTAAKIHLQAMRMFCAECQLAVPMENLEEALSAVSRTLKQVRAMSLDLRPMQLDDFGLVAALRSLLERQAAAAGWKVHVEESLGAERFERRLELVLYRVAQEALTNVMRHARATEIWVTVRQSDSALWLSVRDNGRGFDSAATKPAQRNEGLGLLGMEERVRSVGGRIQIRSSPGGGTEVEAIVPLPVEESGAPLADLGAAA